MKTVQFYAIEHGPILSASTGHEGGLKKMVPRFPIKRIKWLIFCMVVCSWVVIFLLENGLSPNRILSTRNVITGTLPPLLRVLPADHRKHTVILLYSKSDSMGVETLRQTYFRRMNCPVVSCTVTTNRSHVPTIDEFDAIVFSQKKIKNRIGKLPSKRSAKQMYILHHDTPSDDDYIPDDFLDYFNLTMSYRPNADIALSPGRVLSKATLEQIAPAAHRVRWMRIPDRPIVGHEILDNVRKKTKLAAWIMPYCTRDVDSLKHITLIRSLQEHFRIDFAGPCGQIRCYTKEECLEKIAKDYKFLIHIEDLFSHHYISPDTYFIMRYHVVPIIFGTLRYTNYLPKNSHIAANTFSSPEKLAKEVERLDADVIEYTMHFWWKGYYFVQHSPNYCDLCMKTRQMRMSGSTKYYRNMNLWLDPQSFAVDLVPTEPKE